jgi:hypothetical protein
MVVEGLGAAERAIKRDASFVGRMVAQPILEPAAALVKSLGRSIHVVN